MFLHLQSTIFGQLVRLLSRGKLFQYPDEIDLSLWKDAVQRDTTNRINNHSPVEPFNKELQSHSPVKQNIGEYGDEDILLVGWYGPDDPENPQNWPNSLKHLIISQMCFLNFAVYIASSIYVPGEASFIQDFGVSDTVATLGLSLFTLGYGFGPMLWSPLSEMPKLGRSGIFFWTLLGFILFQLPVGLATNPSMFLVFRWVTGFIGSPCLATGAGTVNDIYAPTTVPYMICIWSSAGVLGPVIGPIIGGFLAPVVGWRWTIWVFTCLCSLVLITMFFLLPETSSDNILYNRAKRLRKAAGKNFRSQTEIDSAHYTIKDNIFFLARAFRLTFLEPIVLLMDLYAGLLYGVLFVWFESFPLVFGGIYRFTSGQQGLAFIGIMVFAAISVTVFLIWIRYSLIPKLRSNHFKPEMVLPPTFIGCFTFPICLFWFGWTSREDIHWIVPIIGSGFFSIGVVTLFNSLFNYMGITYAQSAASIFAGSALFRASFGATFPLFARSLFSTLDVGPGNSLLGGIAVLFIPVPFIFYRYGERIRGWSNHATG